jgi:hypothetical protein
VHTVMMTPRPGMQATAHCEILAGCNHTILHVARCTVCIGSFRDGSLYCVHRGPQRVAAVRPPAMASERSASWYTIS